MKNFKKTIQTIVFLFVVLASIFIILQDPYYDQPENDVIIKEKTENEK